MTVATYQALHSAMNQVVGQSQAEDTDDQAEIETFDFKGFDIFSTFKDISLGTLCLDECHHLRNEWWKSLEAFRQAFPDLKDDLPHLLPLPMKGSCSLGTLYPNMW